MNQDIASELREQLENQGWKGQVVSIEHVNDLKAEIEGKYKQGVLDESFYQERLAWFDFNPPDSALSPSV